MKPGVRWRQNAVEVPLFPSRDAGASLKRYRYDALGYLRGRPFPQQRCWGLIEAVMPGYVEAQLLHGLFPSRDAGASLKPVSDRYVLIGRAALFPSRDAGASLKPKRRAADRAPARSSFPQQRCWGLIEAWDAPAVVLEYLETLFPSRDAGASLKPKYSGRLRC